MIECCNIRAVTFDDLSLLLGWRNHPNVRRFMFTQHEISLEEHQNWFTKVSNDSTRRLMIIEEAKLPIGYVQFSNVTNGGIADWGFYARPDSPKGTGRKMGVIALNYAFHQLKLHKVCGQAIEINKASIDFHTRLGFRQEGVLRDQQRIDGVYHTLHCFGLLEHEWHPNEMYREDIHEKD